jgi:S-adenosylmethionine:tRNA ribosyltransferase-isomerase
MSLSYTLDDFDFKLPSNLIAQHPLPKRTSSRLLCLNRKTGEIQHRCFSELPSLLFPNDLLVFNNTKVMKARLLGRKKSGGKLECLIERILSPITAMAHLRVSKKPVIGSTIMLGDDIPVIVKERKENLFYLSMPLNTTIDFYKLVDQYGHVPLPPYINRSDMKTDQERYQTVYAKKLGAIAAPTAGLHFDQALLETIKSKGIHSTELTLHVGSGTFQPVRVMDLSSHVMHQEAFEVSKNNSEAIEKAHRQSGRVIAVGTTVVRALETVAQRFNTVCPCSGETEIFIQPGFTFGAIDALITNFHLPKSTLLMLICAFGGYDTIMRAYAEAVEQKYRFFSYGDAMFIYS